MVHERYGRRRLWHVAVDDGSPSSTPSLCERLWHIRAGRVVLATGAHERPVAFADNDRPGVMLAGAGDRYVGGFGVLPGERAVIFTTNDSTAGRTRREPGVELAEVVDVADARRGEAVTAAHGDLRVEAVTVRGADGTGGPSRAIWRRLRRLEPVTQLWRAIGAGLAYDEDRACFVPNGEVPPGSVVGAAAGEGLPASAPLWFTPAEDLTRHFVDLQRDQTVADVLARSRAACAASST